MTTRNLKKLTIAERSAYHEAGHVVMACLFRRRFSCATIEPSDLDEKTDGCVFLKPIKTLSWEGILCYNSTRIRTSVEREIKIGLAGEVAEVLLVGSNNGPSAKEDIQHCYDLCNFQCVNIEQFEAYIKWLWLCVRDILKLPCNWICAQSVAQYLLKNRRIGYRKARAVIRKAKASYYRSLSHKRQRQSFFKRFKFAVFYKSTKLVTVQA